MQEAFNWVNKIIESCTTAFHLGAAKRLVEYFADMYGKGEKHDELKANLIAQTALIIL